MPKQLTNQVPLKILSVSEYLHNFYTKRHAFYSTKIGYIINNKIYSLEEAEELWPTSYVKVIPKIHPHQHNRQK